MRVVEEETDKQTLAGEMVPPIRFPHGRVALMAPVRVAAVARAQVLQVKVAMAVFMAAEALLATRSARLALELW